LWKKNQYDDIILSPVFGGVDRSNRQGWLVGEIDLRQESEKKTKLGLKKRMEKT